MAVHGKGTSVLQRQIVRRSAAPTSRVLGAASYFYFPDASAVPAASNPIPADLWQGSSHGSGLRSFVQFPVGDAAAPRGALMLATQDANQFDDPK